LEDEKNTGWDDEEIGVECGEAEGFEGKCEVIGFRCLGVHGHLGFRFADTEVHTMGIVHVNPIR